VPSKGPDTHRRPTNSDCTWIMGQASQSRTLTPTPTSTKSKHKMGATDHVVAVERVLARRGIGILPVTSRYTTTRLLEHDYMFHGQTVGSGMSGPVRLGTGKDDGQKYAVKSFRKKGLSSRKRAELKSEAEIYLSLDHPHVARLEKIYETEEELHLVMEYMAGGELYKRLSSRKRYSEEAAAGTIRQVLLAVAYLHAHQVVHRDLKLENFLYEHEESDHLKLIDFGFAKFWDRGAAMSQACGSLHYVAPEVLEHSYTDKADIWSAGVIAYMLLTGAPPFFGADEEVLVKIKSGMPHWSTRFHALSEPAKNFVQGMLVKDVSQRFSAAAALLHPFVLNGRKMTGEERVLDPEILKSLRRFAHASAFRRAVLSMMAWSLSNEDRRHLSEQFLLMDKNNRGTITHQELRTVLEENFHVDSAEAQALFSSLDTDNDDEIEYSEFLAAALIGRVQVHEDLLRRTFARFDTNETGMITAGDLRFVLGDSFDGEEMEQLIHEADTSGDGSVNYEEFLAYFHRSEPMNEAPFRKILSDSSAAMAEEEKDAVSDLMATKADTSYSLPLHSFRGPPCASATTWALADATRTGPPTFSTQSAPAGTWEDARRSKVAHAEKLVAVIDKLILEGPSPVVPRAAVKAPLRPLSRRAARAASSTKLAPPAGTPPTTSLPTLLGSPPQSLAKTKL